MLHLHIYLADVFSHYTTCHQHASANEPHADEQRSPSVYRMPREVFIQGISDHADGYEDKRHTKIGSWRGLMENDVMPSKANDSILHKGYFDSPAKRSLRS